MKATTIMKRSFLTLIALLSVLAVQAQDFMKITESGVQQANLSGIAEAVFSSSNPKLIVESSNSNDIILPRKTNASGSYEYIVQLVLKSPDGTVHRERKFTITEKNSTLRLEVSKKGILSDKRYLFQVTEVSVPIMLKDNTQPTDAHLKNGEACVEIHSTLPQISVEYNKNLKCSTSKRKTDAGIYITSVVIDMNDFYKKKNEAIEKRETFEKYDAILQQKGDATSEEWDHSDELMKEAEKAEALFNDITVLSVSTEGSNELTIDLFELGMKQKRVYEVIVIDQKQQQSNWIRIRKTYSSNIGFGLISPSIVFSSSGIITSAIDYGVSDVQGMEFLERPNYICNKGFHVYYNSEIPVYNKLFVSIGADVSYFSMKNQFDNLSGDLYYSTNDGTFYLTNSSVEKYEFASFNIPLSFGVYLPVYKNKCAFNLRTGFDIGVLLLGKCSIDGWVNNEGSSTDESKLVGSYDLLKGNYNIQQSYNSGKTYTAAGVTGAAPFKPLSLSWHIGASIELWRIELTAQYKIMLSNMANANYWSNEQGERMGGLYLFGNRISSSAGVYDYSHKYNILTLSIGYKF